MAGSRYKALWLYGVVASGLATGVYLMFWECGIFWLESDEDDEDEDDDD